MIITIDLWGTLIKPSHSFKKEKIKLVQRYFTLSDDIISKAFLEVKTNLNSIIERTGWQPPDEVLFGYLFSLLDEQEVGKPLIDKIDLYSKTFITEYRELGIKLNPIIYSDATYWYLAKLKEIGTLVLSSNTVFFNGDTLREILIKLDLIDYFDDLLFSDEIGYSKPNKRMFENSDYHIGDNKFTDHYGALASNSIPFLINSNNKIIKDAYDYITLRNRYIL